MFNEAQSNILMENFKEEIIKLITDVDYINKYNIEHRDNNTVSLNKQLSDGNGFEICINKVDVKSIYGVYGNLTTVEIHVYSPQGYTLMDMSVIVADNTVPDWVVNIISRSFISIEKKDEELIELLDKLIISCYDKKKRDESKGFVDMIRYMFSQIND